MRHYINLLTAFGLLFLGSMNHAKCEVVTTPDNGEMGLINHGNPIYSAFQHLSVNQVFKVNDFQLMVNELDSYGTGSGEVYFEALDIHLEVDFQNLLLRTNGNLLTGNISLAKDIEGKLESVIDVSEAFKSIQHITMPEGSIVGLAGFEINGKGQSIDLNVATPTVVENDYLRFKGEQIPVTSNDICLEGVDMSMVKDGEIRDFQFPLRILAFNPNEKDSDGSYITFGCKGFKNFNLSAVYDFPKNQLESYSLTGTEEGSKTEVTSKQDTVRAYFKINAPTLKSFIVTGSIDAFQVPGVDDMGFSTNEVVIDYSDTTNYEGFKYIDKTTKKQVDNKWKGIYIKSIQLHLPKSISTFKKSGGMQVAINDLVYDRGNGISFEAEVTNLLKIADGNANGWGVSIDTIDIKVEYNSFEKMRMIGDIYIPITEKDENIGYKAAFGKKDSVTTMNFALSIDGTYKLPFLKGSKLTMVKSSKAGMNSVDGKFEPFADLSGNIDVIVGGGDLPEMRFSALGFENLTLGDPSGSAKKDKDKTAEVTGGLDLLAIKAFTFGGKRYALQDDKSETPADDKSKESETESKDEESEKQQKVGGFPISIKEWKFSSDSQNAKIKSLGALFKMNFTTSGGNGISGDAKLKVLAEVTYSKLLSKTPWKAFAYKGTEVDHISVAAKIANVGIKGLIKFIKNDQVYGSGLKGGMEMMIDGSSGFRIKAVSQFGSMNNNRYFFVDASVESNSQLFGVYGMAVYGFKGGLYYNMEKNSFTGSRANDRVLDPTPGLGLSDYIYKPRKGYFGLRAGIIMGLQGAPEVICGDVEFGVDMKIDNGKLSVLKLAIDGNAYMMAKSVSKREEAGISAKAQFIINIEEGKMNGSLNVDVDLPSKNLNIIDGNGQALYQSDISSSDQNNWKNYATIGTQNNPLSFKIKFTKSMVLNSTAYIMIGEYPGNNSSDKDRVAFGFKSWVPKKSVSVWKFTGGYEGKIEMNGSLSTTNVPNCSNYRRGDDYGINGKYMKGNVSANFSANINFGSINILRGKLDASLSGGLPNPTILKGAAKLEAKLYSFGIPYPCDWGYLYTKYYIRIYGFRKKCSKKIGKTYSKTLSIEYSELCKS